MLVMSAEDLNKKGKAGLIDEIQAGFGDEAKKVIAAALGDAWWNAEMLRESFFDRSTGALLTRAKLVEALHDTGVEVPRTPPVKRKK